jgi:hypothetical protein
MRRAGSADENIFCSGAALQYAAPAAHFLPLQLLFHLCLAYILDYYFLLCTIYLLHLLQRLLYVSTFVCPGALLFFFNFFKLKSKPFFTVQYFLIQEPYHTALTVAVL